jgi:hypothetical protein
VTLDHRSQLSATSPFADRGVGFRSPQEQIDTTTPGGKVMHMFAPVRASGRVGGRPNLVTPAKLAVARQLRASGERSMAAIAATLG